ncbi:LOW QUALITY PROTEIN: hypothetical protein HID58_008007, partial [Brassica napus]
DFNGEALEKFIKESSIPLVTVFNSDPSNRPYVASFFDSSATKVMMFVNVTGESAESLKSKFRKVAIHLTKDKYFGVEDSQVPLVIIQTPDSKKYLKANVVVEEIESWMKDFKFFSPTFSSGKFLSTKTSQPIPAENNEPVKVVVAGLDDIVFKSGKNVLILMLPKTIPDLGRSGFGVPERLKYDRSKTTFCFFLVLHVKSTLIMMCLNDKCMWLAQDATSNDIPSETVDAKGIRTIYFRSVSGNVLATKEDLISFIEKNKPTTSNVEETTTTTTSVKIEEPKKTDEPKKN